ncbi:AraC family transcriptional regulator [Niastella koreensis]|uniref:Transcriptional regulator, AraC family n=2 Tax=Niastella koreensis TaxID=354356 RepID=G8T7W1_NIAKG|nr:AraC family transcriptional regulator [Niastella koreensis]AEV96899.1 transcriptional regulator, AraC family [Niastella koreensis GR20-10]OQP49245.1 AraC family transcriptional regulator [Niastella koreensis]
MISKTVHRINTISEYHKMMGLPAPAHPLISVIDYESVKLPCRAQTSFVFDFYSMSLDRNFKGKRIYGRQQCDYDEGVLFFMSPGQVFEIEVSPGITINRSGWLLLFHPDLLFSSPLARTIKQYDYFSYSANESLFLSDKEEMTIAGILQNIIQECEANIDRFSQPVMLAHLELLFTYADRFYQRQFITRKAVNHTVLNRLEDILNRYYDDAQLPVTGLPTVQYVAGALNISAGYLSGLLKMLTGQSTQQYIQDKLVEKAKVKLAVTRMSVSEIAYELGFEHPQSFSRLFKTKTNLSPLEFRQSFSD